MSRPLLTKGIVALEAMFEKASADVTMLRQLADELSHRSVPRAAELRKRVVAALADRSNVQDEDRHLQLGLLQDGTAGKTSSDQKRSDSLVSRLGAPAVVGDPPSKLPSPAERVAKEDHPRRDKQGSAYSDGEEASELDLSEAFRLLGVTRSAAWEEIEDARRVAVQAYGPNESFEVADGAASACRRINAAAALIWTSRGTRP